MDPAAAKLIGAGLACVGLIAAALIWFYLQTQQGSNTASNSPPVVSAPKSKVKVDPPKQSSVPAAAQAVPEPGGLGGLLLALSAMGLAARHRTRRSCPA